MPKPEERGKTKHRIVQDLVNQTTTVELMRSGSSESEDGQTEWTTNLQSADTVSHTDPANAVLKATTPPEDDCMFVTNTQSPDRAIPP